MSMINIYYKLRLSNFAKLDEIIKKQVQNLLGSSLMNFLTWENHINHINSNISRAIFMIIKQVKNLLPTENFVLYYHSPISHIWDFGLE